MPELNFSIEGAEPRRFAAEPSLSFALRVSEALASGQSPTPIHSVVLRCQIRIEPARRRYEPEEQQRLRDLFGTPERWGQTLRTMLWTHVTAVVPPFTGERLIDLPVPCSFDFNHAANRYFAALDGGDLPLCFLFSGTIFFEGDDGSLQVSQISWEKESAYRLSAATWTDLMNVYYPNTAWLCVRKDVFDRLDQDKTDHGLSNHDEAIERLLSLGNRVVPDRNPALSTEPVTS